MPIDYYDITTPPAEPLIPLADAKQWLRVDTDITLDDDIITALIDAAIDMSEKYTNRCFVTRSISGYFSGFSSDSIGTPFLQVRRSPLINLASVWRFTDGDYVEVDAAIYHRQQRSTFDRIFFDDTPSVDNVPYPIRVDFTAGYGAASDIADSIKTAVLQIILFLYENRGDVMPDGAIGLPLESRAIFSKYRILNTF